MLFNQAKQDRMQIFKEILFFQRCIPYKNKQRIDLSFASWSLAEVAKEKSIVCLCIVHSFEKEDFLGNSHPVLSD